MDDIRAPDHFDTDRLTIRKPTLGDANGLFDAYSTDKDVTRYLTWRPHRTAGDTVDFLDLCLAQWVSGVSFAYVVTLADDPGNPFGMIHIRPKLPRVEFGYVLARRVWGNGFMSEALTRLVDWSLAQRPIWRAAAYCDVDNPASARVMENSGMAFEGVLRRYCVHPNVSHMPRDCRMYAKVREFALKNNQ